jgi:hypothetical protein
MAKYSKKIEPFILTERKFDFTGKEKDIGNHIINNLHDISRSCGWGEIIHSEKESRIILNSKVRIDLSLKHKDGTITIIELKKYNKHDIYRAIGQILHYGELMFLSYGVYPRMVIASDDIDEVMISIIKNNKLNIDLLRVDGDICTFIRPYLFKEVSQMSQN